MDKEAVMDFLGCVPIIQRLPSLSLKKIADLVRFQHYETGDHVIWEGRAGYGIYFVYSGEAEVCGPEDLEGRGRSEYQLKRYDYFGHGGMETDFLEQTDVVALSKLTCLVLPNEHCHLLLPKSIWNADETCSLMESILHLESIEMDLFKGITLPDSIRFDKLFGGQMVGQKEEIGFEHQFVTMPSVPGPESLLSMEELRERRLTDPRLPRSYRNKVAKANYVPWPIEIRFCEPTNNTNQTKGLSRLRYWFRARGALSEDEALHRCVVAYVSDLLFIYVSLNPHRSQGVKATAVSLDHAMWFHKSVKADDWILFVISSPIADSGRGFVTGQMFNRKGELIASSTQEGLLRKTRLPSSTSAISKL